MNAPGFNDVMRSAGEDWASIPDAPLPYHIAAKDGLFLHRRLAFGRGLVQEKYFPENWKDVGGAKFLFEADPIPAKIMGRIVHFFQRIYEKQQTEAAVLLTMDLETKEWGVFIPTQIVSHGGVNYVKDPAHIKHPRIIVGSIHSHADFSPFHSGTDTNDAADFDGFHCTVGFVNTTPKIVAMVAMNKEFIHFKDEVFPSLFDWSGVGQYEAPLWWDRYVGMQGKDEKPVGYELFAKFAKPTTVKAERPDTQKKIYPMSEWRGSEDRGTYSYSSKLMQDWSKPGWYGDSWEDRRILRESQQFNAKKEAERGLKWGKDGSLKRMVAEAFWKDSLPDDFVTLLMASGLLTEEDLELALDAPEIAGDITFWREWIVRKAEDVVALAKEAGVSMKLSVNQKTEQETIWLLPEPKRATKNRSNNHGVR